MPIQLFMIIAAKMPQTTPPYSYYYQVKLANSNWKYLLKNKREKQGHSWHLSGYRIYLLLDGNIEGNSRKFSHYVSITFDALTVAFEVSTSPLSNPWVFELLKIGLSKFLTLPPIRSKIVFRCTAQIFHKTKIQWPWLSTHWQSLTDLFPFLRSHLLMKVNCLPLNIPMSKRYNTCIPLERFDTYGSNSPFQPAKV